MSRSPPMAGLEDSCRRSCGASVGPPRSSIVGGGGVRLQSDLIVAYRGGVVVSDFSRTRSSPIVGVWCPTSVGPQGSLFAFGRRVFPQHPEHLKTFDYVGFHRYFL